MLWGNMQSGKIGALKITKNLFSISYFIVLVKVALDWNIKYQLHIFRIIKVH